MRRFSSTFRRSKGEKNENASKEHGLQANDKRNSKAFAPARRSSSDDEHQGAKRGEVVAVFDKFAQVLHASRRPLPTQTGDGTYLEHETSTGLFQDLRSMGFKDVATLRDVMKNKVKGDLVDDKTMLMERIIQVCFNTAAGRCIGEPTSDNRYKARERPTISLEEPNGSHQRFPGRTVEFSRSSTALVGFPQKRRSGNTT